MGWVLRPFIGNPNMPFTLFRGRESNFFMAVLQTLGSCFPDGHHEAGAMNALVGLFRLADDVLRGERPAVRVGPIDPDAGSFVLAALIVCFGMFYGGVMGTYGGIAGPRIWQVVYSAVKVPFLFIATFALSLPSFFVVNTLLGLRDDFARVVRALMATQAGLTVILSRWRRSPRSGTSRAAITSPRSSSTA